MVDVTIDDLTDAAPAEGADRLEIMRSGLSFRLDVDDVAQYANSLLTAGAPTGFDTFAEVAAALSGKQNLDATLTAFAGVTFAADKGLYSTGPDAFATFDLTAGGRALGGVAGTSGTFPYFSASNVVTLGTITAAGRALLDDADTTAQRATLGLVIGTDVQAYDADLAAIAGLTSAADKVPYFTGSGTAALADFTAAGRALLDDVSAAAQRTTLNVDASRLDLTAAPVFFDDFLFASTETGEIGELGWGFSNGSWNLVNPEANHPGTCRRTSSASANAVAAAFPGGGGTAIPLRFDNFDECTWIVKPVTTVADVTFRFGLLSDMTASPPTNGAYIERLSTDTNWFGVARVSGAETRSDLGVAGVADTWVKLKVRTVSATVVAFSVNGGAETQVASNVPISTNNMVFGFQIIPTTANARSLDVDAFSMRLAAPTR